VQEEQVLPSLPQLAPWLLGSGALSSCSALQPLCSSCEKADAWAQMCMQACPSYVVNTWRPGDLGTQAALLPFCELETKSHSRQGLARLTLNNKGMQEAGLALFCLAAEKLSHILAVAAYRWPRGFWGPGELGPVDLGTWGP